MFNLVTILVLAFILIIFKEGRHNYLLESRNKIFIFLCVMLFYIDCPSIKVLNFVIVSIFIFIYAFLDIIIFIELNRYQMTEM